MDVESLLQTGLHGRVVAEACELPFKGTAVSCAAVPPRLSDKRPRPNLSIVVNSTSHCVDRGGELLLMRA